jgi:hypothetical protein
MAPNPFRVMIIPIDMIVMPAEAGIQYSSAILQ